jgi:hypothetical protein
MITVFVYCAECGEYLAIFRQVEDHGTIDVVPCPKCRQRAVDRAYSEGHDAAIEEQG